MTEMARHETDVAVPERGGGGGVARPLDFFAAHTCRV